MAHLWLSELVFSGLQAIGGEVHWLVDRGWRLVRRWGSGLVEGGVLRCLNQDLQDFRIAGDRLMAGRRSLLALGESADC